MMKKLSVWGKSGVILSVLFGLCIVIPLLFISILGSPIAFEHDFYFVYRYDSDNESTTKSLCEMVKNNGGAGYPLCWEGNTYVVVACYTSEDDAKDVCGLLQTKSETCEILKLTTKEYKPNLRERKQKDRINGVLTTLLGNYSLLYDTANLMDSGKCTPQQAQTTVATFMAQLETLQRTNDLDKFTLVFDELKGPCEEILSRRILARDVRYLQICVANALIGLTAD